MPQFGIGEDLRNLFGDANRRRSGPDTSHLYDTQCNGSAVLGTASRVFLNAPLEPQVLALYRLTHSFLRSLINGLDKPVKTSTPGGARKDLTGIDT